MERAVVIVASKTGEVVKSFDVSDKTERQIEKLVDGMSINLNWDAYHIEERS